MMLVKDIDKWSDEGLAKVRVIMTKNEAKLRAEVLGPVIECINEIDLELMRRSNET
jgi:hypothetical protein